MTNQNTGLSNLHWRTTSSWSDSKLPRVLSDDSDCYPTVEPPSLIVGGDAQHAHPPKASWVLIFLDLLQRWLQNINNKFTQIPTNHIFSEWWIPNWTNKNKTSPWATLQKQKNPQFCFPGRWNWQQQSDVDIVFDMLCTVRQLDPQKYQLRTSW